MIQVLVIIKLFMKANFKKIVILSIYLFFKRNKSRFIVSTSESEANHISNFSRMIQEEKED